MVDYNVRVNFNDQYRFLMRTNKRETTDEILDNIKKVTKDYGISNFSSLKVEENGNGESSHSTYYIDFGLRDNFAGLLEKILNLDYVKNVGIDKKWQTQ